MKKITRVFQREQAITLNRLILPVVIAALATGCASNQTIQETREYQTLQSQPVSYTHLTLPTTPYV